MSNDDQARKSPGGKSVLRRIALGLLRLLGWEVEPFPSIDKAIVVGGPHTSNWDGVIGIITAISLDLPARFMIKNSLFKGPLGWLLRTLGAIPIDRAKAGGVVDQTVKEFNRCEHIIIVVTPEGTRTNADAWKTGFHRIARQAGVPVVLATADYGAKRVRFPLVLHPGEDLDADMQRFYDHFSDVTPRHPEKLSSPVRALYEQKQAKDRPT